MGEIANQMINGEACELCLMPFEDPRKRGEVYEHGYPVVCHHCWHHLTDKEKKHHQGAAVDTF